MDLICVIFQIIDEVAFFGKTFLSTNFVWVQRYLFFDFSPEIFQTWASPSTKMKYFIAMKSFEDIFLQLGLEHQGWKAKHFNTNCFDWSWLFFEKFNGIRFSSSVLF